MTAPPSQETNGEPGHAAGQPDGLYRYEPVPPAYYDEDGYLCEDNASQEYWHQRQTSHWCAALNLRLPTPERRGCEQICRTPPVFHGHPRSRNEHVVEPVAAPRTQCKRSP